MTVEFVAGIALKCIIDEEHIIHVAARLFVSLLCRGYYPRGGGEIKLLTSPVVFLEALQMTERGELIQVEGRAFVAGALPMKVLFNVNLNI